VVSPGSRNTPLVLAFDALKERCEVRVVLDERCAAFVALGLARCTGRPTVLVSTSGSAGAHYLPAVIEACHSAVPLLLLTADRPAELHEVGAPQTVQQASLYRDFVRWRFDLPAPFGDESSRWLETIAARALDHATGVHPGPVHLNCRFRKPLWSPQVSFEAPTHRPREVVRGAAQLDEESVVHLAQRLRQAQAGLIVCGPRELSLEASRDKFAGRQRFDAAVSRLAKHLGWPVVAEPLSGACFGAGDKSQHVGSADLLLSCESFAASVRPDLILRFGAEPTNRAVIDWCAAQEQAFVVLVDSLGRWLDPNHSADLLMSCRAVDLCERLCAIVARPGEQTERPWLKTWQRAQGCASEVLSQGLGRDFWEGAIADVVLRALPADSLLHVASSSPVRDLDSYGLTMSKTLTVVGNRGANGIDGTLSTAIGEASVRQERPVTVLLGDLAFLHDVGALALACSWGVDVTILVVDNGGGGLFERLPIAAHEDAFETYFRTPHGLDLQAIAAGFGVQAVRCRDLRTLHEHLASPPSKQGPRVILAQVPAGSGITHRRRLLQDLQAKLS